jgi:hypothetical protein
VEPVTINSNLLFAYVTVQEQQTIDFWQARAKVSEYSQSTRFDFIYVLFRELAVRRFSYRPDMSEIDNFAGSPKPLFENGVISRTDAALAIRFALGEDGVLDHMPRDERSVVRLRLCVYLYRELAMTEAELKRLLGQVERAVARDHTGLTAE